MRSRISLQSWESLKDSSFLLRVSEADILTGRLQTSITMVMAGKINKQAVTILQKNGVSAVGLSGLDGLLVRANRKKRLVIVDERGRKMVIDGGYTGSVSEVNTRLLNLLMENGYIPVISPIAMSEEFEPLNVDGDRIAAFIAGSLKADVLVLLTDVEGLMLEGKVVPRLSILKRGKCSARLVMG